MAVMAAAAALALMTKGAITVPDRVEPLALMAVGRLVQVVPQAAPAAVVPVVLAVLVVLRGTILLGILM